MDLQRPEQMRPSARARAIAIRGAWLSILVVFVLTCLSVLNGLIACFEALANVNPEDKATILAAGISEAINCAAPGFLVGVSLLVVIGITRWLPPRAPPPRSNQTLEKPG